VGQTPCATLPPLRTGPDRTQTLVGAISFAAEYKSLRISEQNLEMLLALGFFALLPLFLWPTL
jgi:hypothetical protein